MRTFDIQYRVTVREQEEIDQKIEQICLEQSVELPRRVLSKRVKNRIVGRLEEKNQVAANRYDVIIRFPFKNIGGEISNFINILYGNISLQPGIRVTGADWESLAGNGLFRGPAHGIESIRHKFSIPDRTLTSTALKPLGSAAGEIGELCFEFAQAGLDIIKDDHGLANQSYAPFEERVQACVRAIKKSSDQSGRRSFYFPNITALAEDAVKRYKKAADLGADGALICPHITGLETMHHLAHMDYPLPLIAHPAFSGGLTTHETQGLSPEFLYGQLWRALGADFIIYPNTGGRFSFTREECEGINDHARGTWNSFPRSFPMPGGGIKLDNVQNLIETYGSDTVLLIGSSLYDHPSGYKMAAQEFSNKVKQP